MPIPVIERTYYECEYCGGISYDKERLQHGLVGDTRHDNCAEKHFKAYMAHAAALMFWVSLEAEYNQMRGYWPRSRADVLGSAISEGRVKLAS